MSTEITFEDKATEIKSTFGRLNLVCMKDIKSSLIVQCSGHSCNTPDFFEGMVIREDEYYEDGYISNAWFKDDFVIWPGKIIIESK